MLVDVVVNLGFRSQAPSPRGKVTWRHPPPQVVNSKRGVIKITNINYNDRAKPETSSPDGEREKPNV